MPPRLGAITAGQQGNWREARRLLENVSQRAGRADPRLLADLALAQLQDGDAAAALASAEQASRLHRASPIAAQVRAMALVRLGREPDLARGLLNKAAAMGRSDPGLAEAQAQLHGR